MGHMGHGRPPAGPMPRIERAAPVIGGWAWTSIPAMDSASMTLLWALYRAGHTAEW